MESVYTFAVSLAAPIYVQPLTTEEVNMRKALTALVMAGALASTLTTTAASAAPAGKVVKAQSNSDYQGTGSQGKGNGADNGVGLGGTPPGSPH
jgi:hypothetical protein